MHRAGTVYQKKKKNKMEKHNLEKKYMTSKRKQKLIATFQFFFFRVFFRVCFFGMVMIHAQDKYYTIIIKTTTKTAEHHDAMHNERRHDIKTK